MTTIKTLAVAAFGTMKYTREERLQIAEFNAKEMVDSIKAVTKYHLNALIGHLTEFNEGDWLVLDECGKALLGLKTFGVSNSDLGQMEVVMKEGEGVWVRIILDTVFNATFEPMYLKGRDRGVLELLNNYAKEVVAENGLTNLTFVFDGTDILAR